MVTYDPERGSPAVLGRHAIADAGLYSVCLAIENLWLAATAEGLGVGWVSFYREEFLRELLDLPPRLRPVAWLCLGPIRNLPTAPDLERHGWRHRVPLVRAFTCGQLRSRWLQLTVTDCLLWHACGTTRRVRCPRLIKSVLVHPGGSQHP